MSGQARPQLAPGERIRTVNGRHGEIVELLGSGGQGAVYKVALDGQSYALKWYHDHYVAIDTGLRTRLERSTRRGAPTRDFLWPLDLATIAGQSSFGYLMRLRDPSFRPMNDIIAAPPRRIELPIEARLRLCSQIASNFLELHAGGFCYQDINFGNFFLDENAQVLICDNDNVNIDGADASIYGTRKFMAPEIVRREKLPDSRTDLFSMSVLFFYILFAWHPLDGARENAISVLTRDDEMRLYGTEPVFIFDPADISNGPVAGVHDWQYARWLGLGARLRDLFVRAFTDGLRSPDSRVMESEWKAAFEAAIPADYACAECGFEQIAEWQGGALACDHECHCCRAEVAAPLFIRAGAGLVSLRPGRELGAKLAAPVRAGEAALARVEEHPRHPGIYGLRNLSEQDWQVASGNGSVFRVAPGQTVRLDAGTTIAAQGIAAVMVGIERETA